MNSSTTYECVMDAFEKWLLDGDVIFNLPILEQNLLFMWVSFYRDNTKDMN